MVYHKPTDYGTCLNGNSECVDKYKNSVVVNYLNRAYKVTTNWTDFSQEMQHIKQMLVNNNYSNQKIGNLMKNFIEKKMTVTANVQPEIKPLNIFYNNQMHNNYKIEERVVKDIIHNNVKSTEPNQRINVTFYYKNQRTSSLVMKNNLNSNNSTLQQTNIIYSFLCPHPHCKADQYIGLTQTTLSRRLTMHAQAGSIFEHFKTKHQAKPTRSQLTENTTIMSRAENRFKLSIKEALLILHNAPSINKQFDNFSNILKIHKHRNNCQNRDDTCRASPNPSAPLPSQREIHSTPTVSPTSQSQVQNISIHLPPVIPSSHTNSPLSLDHEQLNPDPSAPPLSQNHIHSSPSAPPMSQGQVKLNLSPSILLKSPCNIPPTPSAPPSSQNPIHTSPSALALSQQHICTTSPVTLSLQTNTQSNPKPSTPFLPRINSPLPVTVLVTSGSSNTSQSHISPRIVEASTSTNNTPTGNMDVNSESSSPTIDNIETEHRNTSQSLHVAPSGLSDGGQQDSFNSAVPPQADSTLTISQRIRDLVRHTRGTNIQETKHQP